VSETRGRAGFRLSLTREWSRQQREPG